MKAFGTWVSFPYRVSILEAEQCFWIYRAFSNPGFTKLCSGHCSEAWAMYGPCSTGLWAIYRCRLDSCLRRVSKQGCDLGIRNSWVHNPCICSKIPSQSKTVFPSVVADFSSPLSSPVWSRLCNPNAKTFLCVSIFLCFLFVPEAMNTSILAAAFEKRAKGEKNLGVGQRQLI